MQWVWQDVYIARGPTDTQVILYRHLIPEHRIQYVWVWLDVLVSWWPTDSQVILYRRVTCESCVRMSHYTGVGHELIPTYWHCIGVWHVNAMYSMSYCTGMWHVKAVYSVSYCTGVWHVKAVYSVSYCTEVWHVKAVYSVSYCTEVWHVKAVYSVSYCTEVWHVKAVYSVLHYTGVWHVNTVYSVSYFTGVWHELIPTVIQYWVNVLCLLGISIEPAMSSHPCDTGKVAFWGRWLLIEGTFVYKMTFWGIAKWPSKGGWLLIRVAAHRFYCTLTALIPLAWLVRFYSIQHNVIHSWPHPSPFEL